MRFVMTGIAKMEGVHILRDDLIALANSKGHVVDTKVLGAYTDYLVTDSPERLTKKRTTAAYYNIPTISTEEFVDMMGGEIELPRTMGSGAA
jgi:hypothetical protein